VDTVRLFPVLTASVFIDLSAASLASIAERGQVLEMAVFELAKIRQASQKPDRHGPRPRFDFDIPETG